MNAEEAKVPNVDGDWQSIEIFLFSNGQQYSPPRKYFLEAEDLNSWEATLNQLALSHYGLQSPQIDLYTTDGQLVEGPLELKDGHAYVAVAQTNIFIDAGYQKYLLKASRSWEKRQARLKVPECVPGEPCCLCPEKDWCCDLQKCCLCAEKEDLSESFSSATDHTEFRIEGGQFTSSTPAKLEYGTSPAEYEFSSIQVQANPDEYEVKPDNNYEFRPNEYEVMPDEYKATLDEIGPRLNKNGALPREYTSNMSKNEVWTNKDEAREPADSKPFIIEKTLSDIKNKPDKDTGDTDVGIKCHACPFQEQSSALSPIGESELEKKVENPTQIQLIGINEGACVCSKKRDDESDKAKDTETKVQLSEQRVAEIEHKRRANELKKRGTEKEGRTSEPTREFELGGRESEPKSKETGPATRPVSQLAEENRIRLSEQRKKQSGHAARLGVPESKVENHDGGLGNSSFGVFEPSAKSATPGSKPSPRDKFAYRTKNLGHNKTVVPNTIVDEAAIKESDEFDIKDKVTASHITETQQHARKNSFSAGRQSTDKKRSLSGQNSTLLKKAMPHTSLPRKPEDKKPLKTNKDLPPKKIFGNSSSVPVSSSLSEKPKIMSKVPYKRETPPTPPPPTISFTNLIKKKENTATDKDPSENVTGEQEIKKDSAMIFCNEETEFKSFGLGTSKLVNFIKRYSKATQTDPDFEKSMTSTVSEGVQTNIEAVEQQGKEVCNQRDYRIATVDPDENIISIINKGDIINLKLNIEVRNIVKSIHSSQKNSPKSRSLTKISNSEKESQISIEDNTLVQNNALQDLVNDQHYQCCGFGGSPKVMIVQCAGCGPLNNPPRLEPPCCDNDKKYLALLTNSAPEDNTNDNSICSTLCRAGGQQQTQSRRQGGGGIPTNNTFSEITLDTITTVTVSGGPLKKREMNYPTTNTSCRTEDMQNEYVATKRKVNITKDSDTKCSFQKQSVSSLSVTYIENMPSGIKTAKYEEMQVMTELYSPPNPATCQNEQSVCSKATLQISPQGQSKGCQQTSLQNQSQGCMPSPPKCPPCCPIPPPTVVSPQTCIPPSNPPLCCTKPVSTPVCPQASKPPTTSTCCPKPSSIPVCPQACIPPTTPSLSFNKTSSLPVCPQACLPPSTPPPRCPKPPSTPVCPQACIPLTTPSPSCNKPSSIPVCPQACLPPSTPPPCCPKPPSTPVCPQACIPPTTPSPSCNKPSSIPVCPQACLPPTTPPPCCPKPPSTPVCPQACTPPTTPPPRCNEPPSVPVCPQACLPPTIPPPCYHKPLSIPVCPQACLPPTTPPSSCYKPSSISACLPPSTPPPCCPKPPSSSMCPQACKPPRDPPPCCPKPVSTPVCPQGCIPPTTAPPCCPKPPYTSVCPDVCIPPRNPPPCCPKPLPIPACPQGCLQPSSKCPSCCPPPLPCIQIQTQVCPPCMPQVTDSETQTQWARTVLQARRHYDGRYSFHLPPLNCLNNNPA